ncbi:MAG: hypothetical protein ACE5SW_02450 [Nitrososphaeraceae archaeon]
MLINTFLSNAYKKEKDSNVTERILLVRRFKVAKKEAASIVENELTRSKWCVIISKFYSLS